MKKQEFNIKPLDRQFFSSLANRIYNSETRGFLRLCVGKLTNGPDPTNKARRMHCGLGELFFAMTGQHTDDTISESKVVQLAVQNLITRVVRKQQIENFQKGLDRSFLVLHKSRITALESELSKTESSIEGELQDIPNINDDLA